LIRREARWIAAMGNRDFVDARVWIIQTGAPRCDLMPRNEPPGEHRTNQKGCGYPRFTAARYVALTSTQPDRSGGKAEIEKKLLHTVFSNRVALIEHHWARARHFIESRRRPDPRSTIAVSNLLRRRRQLPPIWRKHRAQAKPRGATSAAGRWTAWAPADQA
jgi:hypothetical protein